MQTPKYGIELSLSNLIRASTGISVVVDNEGSVMFSKAMLSGLIDPVSMSVFKFHSNL